MCHSAGATGTAPLDLSASRSPGNATVRITAWLRGLDVGRSPPDLADMIELAG